MIGNFYNLDYMPNRLVYVYEITKTDICYMAFFKLKGEELKVHKHKVSKSSKREFKAINYTPIQQILDLVKAAL